MFHDLCPPGEQTCAGARECVIAISVDCSPTPTKVAGVGAGGDVTPAACLRARACAAEVPTFPREPLQHPLGECRVGGPEPALHELLADARWQAPANSRLSDAGGPFTRTHMDAAGEKNGRKEGN